jgi:TRAP-type uncharacterized transport system substrate-binding protein
MCSWRSSAATAAVTLGLFIAEPRHAIAQQGVITNRGVVEIETAGASGISVRMVEDLANLIDDGATRRVLPVVGKGALQNLTDLRYLRGIDMAILPTDLLEYAREQELPPELTASLTFVTKLHSEELHVLTRAETKEIRDLINQQVNLDLRGSATAVTATRVFKLLSIPITPTYDSPEVALEKLKKGEIAAVVLVAGKPAPLFLSVRAGADFHLLDVPLTKATSNAYVPTRLTSADYPGLIPADRPIDTVAVSNVLAVAELRQIPERYRNVANFVDVFFTSFQSLLSPGRRPKWAEVNIAAELPGWRRYAPADQWLQRNMQIAKAPSPEALRTMFSRFVDERRSAVGGGAMGQQDKDALFQQFQTWQRTQRQ